MAKAPLFALLALALFGACRESRPASPPRSELDCSVEYEYFKQPGAFTTAGAGALEAAHEREALHQIDQALEAYAAREQRLCRAYNTMVIDRATYASQLDEIRHRTERAGSLLEELGQATELERKREVLLQAYRHLVPQGERVELELRVSFLVRGAPLRQGAEVPSGTDLTISVRLSRPAHLYLLSRSGEGDLRVVYPEPERAAPNPVSAEQPVLIPPQGSFSLDETPGPEQFFVVASLEPLPALEQAVMALRSGAPLRPGAADDYLLPRGIDVDDGAVSLAVYSEAAQTLITRPFTFQHVR